MSVCCQHTGAEAKYEQSRARTHTQGGIEAVVTAMGRHAENATLQEEACWVLGNLTDYYNENQAKIGSQVENIHEYI